MIIIFTCNGYDKKSYEEITYNLEVSALPDYIEHFKTLFNEKKLAASYSNETLNITLSELSWFSGYIFKDVKSIKQQQNHVCQVMLEWSTEDDSRLDYYLYHDYTAAKDKYKRLIEDENDADISWVGSEVFDENGNVNKGYHFECSEETDEEQNLCWKVADLHDSNRFSIITLAKVEIL